MNLVFLKMDTYFYDIRAFFINLISMIDIRRLLEKFADNVIYCKTTVYFVEWQMF